MRITLNCWWRIDFLGVKLDALGSVTRLLKYNSSEMMGSQTSFMMELVRNGWILDIFENRANKIS